MKPEQSLIEKLKRQEKKAPIRDEQGRCIINMCVKNDDDFLSPFSATDTPVISPEVAEFVENSTCLSAPGEQFVLRIKSDCIDDAEKELYQTAIREYYTQKYIANDRELRHRRRLAWAMGAVGVLILALAIFWEYRFSSLVWAEFIDIVAWVFIWEAVYAEQFDNRKRRLQKRSYLSYLSMEIQFYSL